MHEGPRSAAVLPSSASSTTGSYFMVPDSASMVGASPVVPASQMQSTTYGQAREEATVQPSAGGINPTGISEEMRLLIQASAAYPAGQVPAALLDQMTKAAERRTGRSCSPTRSTLPVVQERAEPSDGEEDSTKKVTKKPSIPMARTKISQPSLANSSVLHVESFADFRIGMQIKITSIRTGLTMTNKINRFGSIITETPLEFAVETGDIVEETGNNRVFRTGVGQGGGDNNGENQGNDGNDDDDGGKWKVFRLQEHWKVD